VLRLGSGWCLELFRGHDELLAESHDRGGSDKSFQLKPCLPLPRRHTIIRFASTSEWDGLPHPTRQLSSWPILPSSHDPRTHHSRTPIPRPLQLEDRGIFKDKELAFVANLSEQFPLRDEAPHVLWIPGVSILWLCKSHPRHPTCACLQEVARDDGLHGSYFIQCAAENSQERENIQEVAWEHVRGVAI
jgi:hypothetical protein